MSRFHLFDFTQFSGHPFLHMSQKFKLLTKAGNNSPSSAAIRLSTSMSVSLANDKIFSVQQKSPSPLLKISEPHEEVCHGPS